MSQAVQSGSDKRFKLVESTMKRHQYRSDALIEVLHTAQEVFGCLTPELLLTIARSLKLPPSWVYGVATFYHFFSLTPKGEHSCVVCLGTACYVKGAGSVLAGLEQRLPRQGRADDLRRQGVAPHRPLPGDVRAGPGRGLRRQPSPAIWIGKRPSST